eukprot:gene17064-18782_t
MGLVSARRSLCTRLILLGIIMLAIIVQERDSLTEAKPTRPKRSQKCSLRITKDGRYAVICVRGKSFRKGSRSNGLGIRKSKKGKKADAKSKKSTTKRFGNLLTDQALKLARSTKEKRKNRVLVCKERMTKWVSKNDFPNSDAAVSCNAGEFLQGFATKTDGEKVRYTFTCCLLP